MQNNPDNNRIDPQTLIELVSVRIPFGKYKNRLLCDLPEPYLVWLHQKGFPIGKIGLQLSTMYEIKLNGLDYLLIPLKSTQKGLEEKSPSNSKKQKI
jgi:uncharacterized protein